MRILVVGVFSRPNSTNVFLAKALRELEYEVGEFDYRALAEKLGVESMNAGLVYEVLRNKPDVVIICKGDSILPDSLTKIVKFGTKVHYWFMDPIQTINKNIVDLALESTSVSCTGGGVAKVFADYGVRKVAHIFEGVDSSYYYPKPFNKDYESDFLFIGTRTEERMKYLYWLGSEYKVRVYGLGFGPLVEGEAFNDIYSSSKAMVSINTQNDIPNYFSDRVFLYLGARAFVFQKYSPELERYFENRKHLVWFDTVEELLSLAKEYMSGDKDKEIEDIKEAGYQYVLQHFTWQKSAKLIMENLE